MSLNPEFKHILILMLSDDFDFTVEKLAFFSKLMMVFSLKRYNLLMVR